jgi:hypothetical protein
MRVGVEDAIAVLGHWVPLLTTSGRVYNRGGAEWEAGSLMGNLFGTGEHVVGKS